MLALFVCRHFVRRSPRPNCCPVVGRFFLLLVWRLWLRRKRVRTFLAACGCRASWACFIGTLAAVPGCNLFPSHNCLAFMCWPLSRCGWSVRYASGEALQRFNECRPLLNPILKESDYGNCPRTRTAADRFTRTACLLSAGSRRSFGRQLFQRLSPHPTRQTQSLPRPARQVARPALRTAQTLETRMILT